MVQKQILLQTIDAQRDFIEKKAELIPRELYQNYSLSENFAIIISGIRRSGKSTVLFLWLQSLNDADVMYLNFDNSKLFGFEFRDFELLDMLIAEQKKTILFFDEIQVVEGWEVYVREKLDQGYKIVITGSNASLLSKELGTKLTGRHLSREMFPFSYTEFLSFCGELNTVENFMQYMILGGFPEYLKTRNEMVLQSLFDDIIYRGIAVRYRIRECFFVQETGYLFNVKYWIPSIS
ncbi:MAG: ATP-binding protein [Paludibacter sp.]